MRRRPHPGFSDDFDKFTDRARNVLRLAQEDAQRFGHPYIGTEHLLLGLVREDESVAVVVLRNLGVEPPSVRDAVVGIIGRTDRVVLGEVGLTPRAKKVIELAVDEGRRMNHHYIGTEHLLLGLVREGEGIAARVLESLGVNLEKVRTQTIQVLSQRAAVADEAKEPEDVVPPAPLVLVAPPAAGPKNNVVTCRLDDRSLDALDALVEAGVRATRSDAAAWLIAAGIDTHQALFDRLAATIQTIRELRQEAQAIAHEVASAPHVHAEAAPPADSGEPPPPPRRAVQDDSTTEGAEGEEKDEKEGNDTPPQAPLE
jgi:ATP-dependent Clp protease ATP-binding subunit ClpA